MMYIKSTISENPIINLENVVGISKVKETGIKFDRPGGNFLYWDYTEKIEGSKKVRDKEFSFIELLIEPKRVRCYYYDD